MYAANPSYALLRTHTDASCVLKWICWSSGTILSIKLTKNLWKAIPSGEGNLFSINAYRAASRRQLRLFGFILAAGFFVIAIIPAVFRHASAGRLALTLSAVFATAAIF